MKIHVDVECTPQEARTFLGLPDMEPMQKAVMDEIQNRMMQNMQALDVENILKSWVPAGIQGFEQLQKLFWQAATMGQGKDSK